MGHPPIIYIRVDANREIATGHVMRTLAIAKQVKNLGGRCKFIVSDEYAMPIILRSGFEVICLNSKWNDLNQEISQMQQIIKLEKIKVVLVDSYFVTKEYLESLSQKVLVAYIDDLNLFKYPVQVIINYSIYYEKFCYELLDYPKETTFLLGGKYALLREEFKNLIPSKRNDLTNVLVTSGGTDEYHVTYKLVKFLCQENILDNLRLHVVIGRFNQDKDKIKQLVEVYNNIQVHEDISYMSQLMMECDIAVSAGGTTLYELCACGLFTICFGIADNQLMGIEAFAEKGLMYTVGDLRKNIEYGIQKIAKQIQYFSQHPDKCYEHSKKMQSLVDGNGAKRIATHLLELIKKIKSKEEG